MITNKKLYEMIAEQMHSGNEELRANLKSHIADKTAQAQSLAQEFADRQSEEISTLSAEMNHKLNVLQSELSTQIHSVTAEYSETMIQKLTQEYDAKLENLKSELFEKLDENFFQVISTGKLLSDGINNLQKDTAVIMETLQLILTNMMLDSVETIRDAEER